MLKPLLKRPILSKTPFLQTHYSDFSGEPDNGLASKNDD
jgi:hypothetical protein